ncbi:MAG TPA: molybdate ABC transporter substrate-binding protein [Vicinamibacteria bacterium]|nr:molybdate ABC transporter substrate-binding protein [Vicinamibacteria bacterium]
MRGLAAWIPAGVVLAGASAGTASAETVRVLAASSLTEAFREIAAGFEAENPGITVEVSFGGSQALRTQIEQGAPADVFASADREHAEALVRAGLLAPTRVFARNVLVAVVPAGGAKVASLADLARPGMRVVLAGPAVPAGRYAAEALRRLGTEGGLGPAFGAAVRANVVSEETNVRAVLSKVVLGEADAGFVYATDAATSGDRVRTLELPVSVVAEYPIGVVAETRVPAAAAAFVDRVLGERGQAILRRHGFR